MLVEYMKNVPRPFILSGDFNLTSDSQTIQQLNNLATNLTLDNHVTNTLNAHTHKAKHLFPPGLAVDYIYTSKDVVVEKFAVVEEDLSDHLGLIAMIEA